MAVDWNPPETGLGKVRLCNTADQAVRVPYSHHTGRGLLWVAVLHSLRFSEARFRRSRMLQVLKASWLAV